MRTFVALFLLLLGSHLPLSSHAACCVDVILDIAVQGSVNGPMLKASLRNNSAVPLEINKSLLPWGSRYSLILTAVREKRPNEQLSQKFFIDDIGPETIELKAGDTIEGQIDMREFFEGLGPELDKGSLIAMWSYKLVTVGGDESKRLSGWVRVPKR